MTDAAPRIESLSAVTLATTDMGRSLAFYASLGASSIATCGSIPGHPYSHRSNTVDFLIVTEGEVTLVLDTGETTLRAGEIGVVRGGNHALANRTGRPAVVAIAAHEATSGN